MNKHFLKLDYLRRDAALAVGVLMVLSIVFITLIAASTERLNEQIYLVENYKEASVELFLEQSILIDSGYVKLLKNRWNERVLSSAGKMTTEEFLQYFVVTELEPFTKAAGLSLILFIERDNQIVYLGYSNEEYDRYRDYLLGASIDTNQRYIVLNRGGDVLLPFGKGDRIYLIGAELLTLERTPLYLYVGFHESIRYESFINSLNVELLNETKDISKTIMQHAVMFMFLVFVTGVLIMFMVSWATKKVKEENNKIKYVCEIAREKGFMTPEQIEECLTAQENKPA